MYQSQIDERVREKIPLIHEVPDSGVLAVQSTIEQAKRMHGMTASPHRERETTERFFDILAVIFYIFISKHGQTYEQVLAEIFREREHQKKIYHNDHNLTQEVWLIIIGWQCSCASNLLADHFVNRESRPLYSGNSYTGRLLAAASLAFAALEHS